MLAAVRMVHPESVLFISLDSCRYDSALALQRQERLTTLAQVGPLYQAQAPSHFTYGSHAAFWVGFTPGVAHSSEAWLNPKVGKLFRMAYAGSTGQDGEGFQLTGANIVEGFRRGGYATIGSGAVEWFNPATETGAQLGQWFEHFHFAGDTWSLQRQLEWIDSRIQQAAADQPLFVFLNVGETHVPYWHVGAEWPRFPSPCRPFGGDSCSALESSRRQQACLGWVDQQLAPLVSRFLGATLLICADHGDCWGEDGLWEHGISHPATLTVPLWLRVRGQPIQDNHFKPSPSRIRSAFARLRRWLPIRA